MEALAYAPGDLDRLHRVELMIYKDFSRVCDAHGLTYFGFSGTSLGALRHKGFIPWDDDMDIGMPRDDFETFKKVFSEMGDKYYLECADEDEHWPSTVTRVMVKDTAFRDVPFRDIPCRFGIFMDLVPFDYIPDDDKLYRKQAFTAWFWSKIHIIRCMPRPYVAGKGVKQSLLRGACFCAHYVLRALGIRERTLYLKCKKAMMRYADQPSKRISYLCDTDRFANTIALEDLYPIRHVPFEDTTLAIPKEAEKMLEQMYPDFMTPPPPEKRKNHCPLKLDFGPYGGND